MDLDSSKVVDLVIWSSEELLAAIKYDEVRTDKPTLFKSIDGGGSWTSMEVDKPEELDYFVIRHLEKQSENPQTIVAYVGRIVQSEDGGNTWKIIYNDGYSEFLNIGEDHPDHIWTGGQNTIFGPALAKSEDGGETWTKLNRNIYTGSDGRVMDVILHPSDPDRVLVAMGLVRRTNDGGQNWEDTPVQEVFVFTFTHSIRHVGVVYAGGINEDEKVVFAQSPDFGNTWQIVAFEDGPTGIRVNDMEAVETGGREVLYFGTNQGVFSYTFEN